MSQKQNEPQQIDNPYNGAKNAVEPSPPHSKLLGKGFVVSDEALIPPKLPFCAELCTKDARYLLFQEVRKEGKKNNHMVGVDTLNAKLPAIYKAAQNDDPFADQIMLDIEKAISKLSIEYRSQQQKLENSISAILSSHNMTIEANTSAFTSRAMVNSDYELVTKMLFLLTDADRLLYTVFLAQKCTAIDRKQAKLYQRSIKDSFRKVIRLIYNWKKTDITRIEMQHPTQRTIQSIEANSRMILTSNVLLMEERAATAPHIPTRPNDILEESVKDRLIELYVQKNEPSNPVPVMNNTGNLNENVAYQECDNKTDEETTNENSLNENSLENPLGSALAARAL